MNAAIPSLSLALQYHHAGHLAEAEQCYRQILHHHPRQARVHLLLGLLYYQSGQNQAALETLRQAVALAPTDPVSHSSLALIYRGLGHFEAAISSYQNALKLNPQDAADHYELGITYTRLEQLDQAAGCFRRALSLRPEQVLWRLELESLCPAIMPNRAAITTWRACYEQTLDSYPAGSINLSQQLPELLQANTCVPFNLSYHGEDDRPLKEKYARLFTVEIEPPAPDPLKAAGNLYRIGFLVTRGHERIFLSLMGGLLDQLTDPSIQAVVICSAASIKILRTGIKNERLELLPVAEELPLALHQLKAANLDLIYYWEVGSDPLNYFLPFFRPAPIQCTSWGLSDTTGVPQIDYFISSDLLETAGAEAHYSERLVRLKTLPTYFYRPTLPSPLKTRADFNLPGEAHLYFCPQNLLKLHPDFDPLLAEILRRDPQGQLLLLRGNVPGWTEDLRRRFDQSIPEVSGRIRFLPPQPFADFLNLVALADVILDPIHYSGGNTTHEILATGTPIVTLPSPFLRGRLTLGRYQKMGLLDCVAASPQEYVTLAVRLGTDPVYREGVKAKILAANDTLYEDRQAVEEMSHFFKQAIDTYRAPKSFSSNGHQPAASPSPVVKTLTFDGKNPPAAWPTVSLCMIVKNEENTLAACLASAGDFASEIIIVDTGSTDRTVEIAKSFGAQIRYFPWQDDFAAARNESIGDASGEWIFWMDADDRLSPQNLARLKQALVSGEADVYGCDIVSQTAQQERARVTIPHWRLFRNHLGLRFEYPLHETLALNQSHRPITAAYTNIQIEHIGYVLDEALFKAKTRRNLHIVRQCLAQTPNSLRWQHYLGMSLSILGEYPEAIQTLEAVLAQTSGGLNEVDRYHAHLTLAANYLKTHHLDRAEQILKRTLACYNSHHLLLTLGMFYLDQDQPQEAVRWLERAGQMSPEASHNFGYTWLPGTREEYLGQAQLLLAHPAEAAAAYRAMLIHRPGRPSDPAALRRLAQAEWAQRHWDGALSYMAQAIGLSGAEPGEWVWLAAGQILKTGQGSSARRLCRLALAQQPAGRSAGLMLDLLEQSPQGIWPTLTVWIDRMLTGVNPSEAQASLHQMAGLFNLPLVELIRQHGRRLISQKAYQPASEAFALLTHLAPTDADAYRALGVTLYGLGHEAEAMAAWQVAQKFGTGNGYEPQK